MVLLFAAPVLAAEVEGVSVPEKAVADGQTLVLNGAGVRTKFFFDIYVGALYLPARTRDARQAIEGKGPKRVTMHFLYGEVGRKKLTDGWIKGFEKNQSKHAMAKLRDRLAQFNAMFTDARKGDEFVFDFLANGDTRVILKGETKGVIPGENFARALLAVWLGRKPADKGLKKAMLAASR
ncbi:MAG: chalcone isomerase family protein [Mariprofundaceae bacterium]|nr:chalcone isomerase family protein [Mariprofundaceae bacterium]